MSQKDTTHGLSCPNCGGVVPIPEGQVIVRCPYCDLRSFVRGERGLRRYQVPQRAARANSLDLLRQFLRRNWAIARDAPRRAQLTEAFLVYLPFWTIWARVAAWIFGQERVGSGDDARWEPREVRVVQEMVWNGAACDVGEFGVNQIPLSDQALEPFDPEALHSAGMVFEPVGSFSQAQAAAEEQFQDQVRSKGGLDRVSQIFTRPFRRRFGLVYYPLWVLRYLYRGRAFQVVVDSYSGQVLYGKAPGNTLYRAAVLVAGMAIGAILAIDAPAFLLSVADFDDGGEILGLVFFLFLVGLGIMFAAYRAFRHGEQFEYHRGSGGALGNLKNTLPMIPGNMGSIRVKDLEQWIDRLS